MKLFFAKKEPVRSGWKNSMENFVKKLRGKVGEKIVWNNWVNKWCEKSVWKNLVENVL